MDTTADGLTVTVVAATGMERCQHPTGAMEGTWDTPDWVTTIPTQVECARPATIAVIRRWRGLFGARMALCAAHAGDAR